MYAKIGKYVKIVVDAKSLNLNKLNKLRKLLKERGLKVSGSYNVVILEVLDRIYFMGKFLWLISEKPKVEIFLQGNKVTVKDKYYDKEYEFDFD